MKTNQLSSIYFINSEGILRIGVSYLNNSGAEIIGFRFIPSLCTPIIALIQ